MLELALNHQEQLNTKFRQTWEDDKYKYYHNANYREDMEIPHSTWTSHNFVSLHDGEVIGYIGYQIDRSSDYVYGLGIINFAEEQKAAFAKDLGVALRNIFDKYNFRRLEWSVVIGNPIERSYDKLCYKYGGRIVGTYINRYRLIDGRYYDEKLYEIEKGDYDNAIKR